MIRFESHFSLQNYHTFKLPVETDYFFEFTEISDLPEFLRSNESWKAMPLLFLGGGSNLLFTDNFHGLVLEANIPGVKVVRETAQEVWVEAGAGEDWDDFVDHCVENGYGGIENLSLIPGRVGAVPVQNIGAYGVEAGPLIDQVNGFDLQTLEDYQIDGKDCQFAYRDSLFKRQLKGRFMVTSVVFRLSKYPQFNLDYGVLAEEVAHRGGPGLKSIREAVIAIRQAKLPDPSKLANAGSFFKNPVIDRGLADSLKKNFPTMPFYPSAGGQVKLAAGWLIDQCGWKGIRRGDTGVHDKQALVLVNYGQSSGKEIVQLAMAIQNDVHQHFGIDLEPEVNIIH